MDEAPRNAPCPCGSGKKYKRCCINQLAKSEKKSGTKQSPKATIKTRILAKYNSKELLKIFSLLQLQPKNHGKNIRLEETVTEIVQNINQKPSTISYSQLTTDILEICTWTPHEDPPEEFFTENIVFVNGNNIVYPGIASNGTEIVQSLINSIIADISYPKPFLKEVFPGLLLILHIHTSIAKKLGHTHRLFEEETSKELFIPAEEVLMKNKDLFSFSIFEIKAICDELKIPYNAIDQFVFRWQDETINFTNPDENPLFQKPFVFIDNEFVLVLPTAELLCLNEFILQVARKHACLNQLIKTFADDGLSELLPYFWKMNWDPVRFNFSTIKEHPRSFVLNESLWQIDTDKFAYVTVITEDPAHTQIVRSDMEIFSKQYSRRIYDVLQQFKQTYPLSKLLLVNFTHKSRILALFGLALNKIDSIDFQLHLTPLILQVLVQNWKFDQLTLWKYAKYLHLAEEKIRFMPLNTHLAKFDYYKSNEDSFFHPDKEAFDIAFFGFEIESEVRRNGIAKLDKIGIPYLMDDQAGYLQCYRKERYYPVYLSQEINFGILRNCLLKYSCPIWISSNRERDFTAEIYINGILYWLNELFEEAQNFINQLGQLPVSIKVELDEAYYIIEEFPTQVNEAFFLYSIHSQKREIVFRFPLQMVYYFSTADNLGERHMMNFLLNALGELIEQLGLGNKLQHSKQENILNKVIPTGIKKMITISTAERDLKIADVDLVKARKIPHADISYILENQVAWLNYNYKVPRKLVDKKTKVQLLNDLVKLHFEKITEAIVEYDALSLLMLLMKRHEALIQKRAFRQINYPVRQACYSQYYDVLEEFSQTEIELNEANLCMRVLIEFVACLMPSGAKKPNEDDVDMLLAHMVELVNYGSISDEIQYGIQDPEIGQLPSGRIGISKRYENNTLKDFKQHIYNEEFDSYSESFDQFFNKTSHEKNEDNPDPYMIKVSEAFKAEWEISLFDLHSMSYFITSYLFRLHKSVALIKEDELYTAIKQSSNFSEKEITAYIQQLRFVKREGILKPPAGFDRTETYPWRYNRRLSYLMKPIINIQIDRVSYFLISARHLYMASENLLALFYSGTLKVKKDAKKLHQLLAERNNIKGKRYREEVCTWLRQNTSLKVFNHEIKISPKGFFIADMDKGDVDLMAIDGRKKIIYCIECKNTSQSKVAYEFKSEIDTYLGVDGKEGLIQKHVNRHVWLEQNKGQVLQRLGLSENYEVVSLVISKYILPLKHIKQTPIPIFSFYDLKTGNLSFE